MKRYQKKALKVAGILLGFLVLLYLIAFTYVTSHKKSIIKEVTSRLSKQLNGTVSVDEVELNFFRSFPRISVSIGNVSITDTMYAQHRHAFFTAKQVYAQLDIFKLLKKQSAINGFIVEKGSLYLYTDTSGYSNTYLLGQKKNSPTGASDSGEKNELKLIVLKDVRVIIDDRENQKFYDAVINNVRLKIHDRGDACDLFAKTDMMVHGLAFNVAAGSFIREKRLEGNFDLNYDKKLRRLQFDSIDIKLSAQPFNLSGWFDLGGADPQFRLIVHTRQVSLPFAKSLMTEKLAAAISRVDLDKGINADVLIHGPLNGGDPFLNVSWNIKDGHLTTPFCDLKNASLNGFYTDEATTRFPDKSIDNTHKENLEGVAKKKNLVLDQGILNVHLKASKLVYKKIETSNVIADLSLSENHVVIKKMSFEQAGGTVNLNGSLITAANEVHYTTAHATMHNVAVNKLFKDFDNFGQDGITWQNLEGNLSATINASLQIDKNGNANPNSIESIIDFSLKNGTLINFEPVNKLQILLFKNRDFNNIHFAELKDRLKISNREVTINRMEIQSNVLTMYVEGIYSMKGNTDLSIQVPFSNLKKRPVDYQPENRGIGKAGPSLFIKGKTGADGNIEFKLDLFNKLKTESKKPGKMLKKVLHHFLK